MKVFAVKNGLRYFKKQLQSTDKPDKILYYQSEIFRLNQKLEDLESKQETYGEIIQE